MPKNTQTNPFADDFLDLNALTPQELARLNTKLRRRASQRARRLDKGMRQGRLRIGKRSRAYKQAVQMGLVKPTNKEERRLAPKTKTPFSKLERKEQIKRIRDLIAWLNGEFSSLKNLRKLYKDIGKGFGEGSTGDNGKGYSGYVFDIYRRFCDLFPSLNYMVSRNPRHRYNSDQWLEEIADIVDSSSSPEEIFEKLTEMGEEAYEEQQAENAKDDSDFFNGTGR